MDLYRCPGCRLQCQLMCSTCVSTFFRLNKIREAYRNWFLNKAEICQKIDEQLKPEMHFKSDLYAKQRSVQEMRRKLQETKDSIGRLKRRLALTDVRMTKCNKNVKTLEKKAVSHAHRIDSQTKDNEKLRKLLALKQNEKYVKETKLKKDEDGSVGEMMKSKSPPVQQWPPVKKYFYTVNCCAIDDFCEYNQLISDLLEGSSSLFLARHSKHAYSALLYTISFTNTMAIFLDLTLPYQFTLKEFALCNHWTQDLFATDMFRLNVNIATVCRAFGLSNDTIKVNQPFHNLHNLVMALKQNQVTTVNGILNERMNHQIVDFFHKFSWEERQDNFEIDNIEEDWVNVGFTVR